MPSNSLITWRTTRKSNMDEIDAQCAASLAATPADPALAGENVRGYGLLLSAHFQGFCRDLYTEASQAIVERVRPALQAVVQLQFSSGRRLDHGNPIGDNLNADFKRFGFTLDLAGADPDNAERLSHLANLNKWRNIAAHHGYAPPGAIPSLATLRVWATACDGLATSLDGVVFGRLKTLLRRKSW